VVGRNQGVFAISVATRMASPRPGRPGPHSGRHASVQRGRCRSAPPHRPASPGGSSSRGRSPVCAPRTPGSGRDAAT